MYKTSERPKFHLVPTKFPKSVTFSSQQSNKVPSNRRHLKLFLYEICNHATVTDRSSKTFFCFDKKLQKNNFLSFGFSLLHVSSKSKDLTEKIVSDWHILKPPDVAVASCMIDRYRLHCKLDV